MATGRTSLKNWRVYVDGYRMCNYSRSFGPLACTFEEGMDDALCLDVKGVMPGSANISMGTLNGLMDNTATSGIHAVMSGINSLRDVMLPVGIQTAPANNDPVFVGQFVQLSYTADPAANPVSLSVQFSQTSAIASNKGYAKPWGVLLHADAAATAANTATGLDQAAATTKGGYMMYQVFSGDGTATIKTQHATTNLDGSFSDLLSSGVIDCSSPISDVVALASTATVNRYIRWQIALGTASTVTFALAFVRNTIT